MTLKTAPADVATQVDQAGDQWVRLADIAELLAAHLQPREPDADVVWLDTEQAAQRAKRHRDTVSAALRDGSLHGHQRRRKGPWIAHPAVVDAWAAGLSEDVQRKRCACTPAEPRGRAGAR